jgi:hypothetical protein
MPQASVARIHLMYCGQCGTEIPSDSRFCSHCGRPVGGSYPSFERLRYPAYPAGSFRSLFSWYMITLALYFIICCLCDVINYFCPLLTDEMDISRALLALLLLLFIIISGGIIYTIYWAYLLYRCWAVIQDDEHVETTPGLAVGLTFIPFFNYYWCFVAQLGLVKGMNIYCRKRNIDTPILSENLAICNCWVGIFWSIWGFLSLLPAYNFGNSGFLEFCLKVIFCITCFVLEYALYSRYAQTAGSIQQYKLSQNIPSTRGTPNTYV